jgi:hypothetical protein
LGSWMLINGIWYKTVLHGRLRNLSQKECSVFERCGKANGQSGTETIGSHPDDLCRVLEAVHRERSTRPSPGLLGIQQRRSRQSAWRLLPNPAHRSICR